MEEEGASEALVRVDTNPDIVSPLAYSFKLRS